MNKPVDYLDILKQVCKKIFPDIEINNDSDFFELGGTSVDVVKLSSEFNKKTGITIDIATVYEYSTLSELAEYLSQNQG